MDETTLAETYRRCGATIFRRCLKLLGDPALAQDATQEVFVRLIRHGGRLEPREGYLPWIYRVATNHCLNLLRDEARLVTLDLDSLAVTADLSLVSYAQRDLTVRLLRRFDDTTAAVAVLALVDGLSQEEIAEVLEISRKTVGRKLRHFIERAQRFVGEAG